MFGLSKEWYCWFSCLSVWLYQKFLDVSTSTTAAGFICIELFNS